MRRGHGGRHHFVGAMGDPASFVEGSGGFVMSTGALTAGSGGFVMSTGSRGFGGGFA